MLIQEIKDRQVAARKEAAKTKSADTKVEVKLLTTLIGEADRQSKMIAGEKVAIDDEALMALIKKFIKDGTLSCSEVKKKGNDVARAEAEYQLELMTKFLMVWLPQQMSEAELEAAIKDIVTTLEHPTMKQMGQIMGKLNGKYKGLFDGKVANKIVRSALS